jgi:hypothetical protein
MDTSPPSDTDNGSFIWPAHFLDELKERLSLPLVEPSKIELIFMQGSVARYSLSAFCHVFGRDTDACCFSYTDLSYWTIDQSVWPHDTIGRRKEYLTGGRKVCLTCYLEYITATPLGMFVVRLEVEELD